MMKHRFQNWRTIGFAIALAAGTLACASIPPLSPELDGLVNRSWMIAGALGSDEKVTGKTDLPEGTADFAAYYSSTGLQAIGVKGPGSQGSSTKTTYYVSEGKVFYIHANTSGGTAPLHEIQLFFDASGAQIGSRKIIDGKVGEVTTAERDAIMNRYETVRSAASQARGPGHKIAFDLSKINSLGLEGPPLHTVHYGFCFPADPAYTTQIQGIDSAVKIDETAGAGCAGGEWRATGSTHQPGFKQVLLDLAGLPYVSSIQKTGNP